MNEPRIDLAQCDRSLLLHSLEEAGIAAQPSLDLPTLAQLLTAHYRKQLARGVDMALCDKCNGVGPAADERCPYCGEATVAPEAGVPSAPKSERQVCRSDPHEVDLKAGEHCPEPEAQDEDEDGPVEPDETIGPDEEVEEHEYAGLFPLMNDDELAALAADIKAHGQRERVVVAPDGRLLDGRNRLRACRMLGIKARFTTFAGSDRDVFAYVVSGNYHRRHLSLPMRAMIAAKLATLQHGQRQTGKLAGLPTQAQAAKALNVSERTVRDARTVREHAAPELVAAVEAGKVAVSAAAKVANDSPDVQLQLVATPKKKKQPSTTPATWSTKASLKRVDAIVREELDLWRAHHQDVDPLRAKLRKLLQRVVDVGKNAARAKKRAAHA
jgi:ParB-like chromosome segregation protein Spo0J